MQERDRNLKKENGADFDQIMTKSGIRRKQGNSQFSETWLNSFHTLDDVENQKIFFYLLIFLKIIDFFFRFILTFKVPVKPTQI